MMNITTITPNGTYPQYHLSAQDYILVTLHALIFIIGTTGNILVCKFFKLEHKNLTHIEHWIYYLALTDLFASILDPPLYIYWKMTSYNRWDFGGSIGCKVIPVLSKTCKNTTFGILMLLNIERCLLVLFPYRRLAWSVFKNRAILCLIVVLSFILNLHNVVYTKISVTQRSHSHNCHVPNVSIKGYGYSNLLILLTRDTLFLMVFVTTNLAIRGEFKKTVFQSTREQCKRDRENKSIMKTLFVISLAFIVLVFPRDFYLIVYQASWLSEKYGIKDTKEILDLNSLLKFIQSLNNIYNVFVYAKIHRRFQKSVKRSLSVSFTKERRQRNNVVMVNRTQITQEKAC